MKQKEIIALVVVVGFGAYFFGKRAKNLEFSNLELEAFQASTVFDPTLGTI